MKPTAYTTAYDFGIAYMCDEILINVDECLDTEETDCLYEAIVGEPIEGLSE